VAAERDREGALTHGSATVPSTAALSLLLGSPAGGGVTEVGGKERLARPHRRTRSDRAEDDSAHVPVKLELVGLAGVGKSHLKSQLIARLPERLIDVHRLGLALTSLRTLPAAVSRVGSLVWFMLMSSPRDPFAKLRFCGRLLHLAWLEEEADRLIDRSMIALAEEGWYHKLRHLRRLLGRDVAFLDLPAASRQHLFRADVVIHVTADPMEICARKLRRNGREVTPDTLAEQYARSGARGQWQEQALTRRDLDQAAGSRGLRVIEIDYGPHFDVDRDLVPTVTGLAGP
jgi:hypothetical protein